ncbi:MAG: mismatch-specific DNA-glycosylase [Candidatus Eremiobacteraeota bacterium]|nr:mismatch-specific DNA-glycosylase [Candidatus Eremiobacteraeota bacterium]
MYRTSIDWLGREYSTLEDILDRKLKVVFVGLNPSPVSVDAGHYHYGMLGKRFWNTIIRGKIFKPEAGKYYDELLLKQKMGITDIVKRPTRGLKHLTKDDFEEGRKQLFQKVIEYKPKILCSIYKSAFEHLFETKFTNLHGLQDNFRFGKTKIFIMASPFLPREIKDENIRDLKKLLKIK